MPPYDETGAGNLEAAQALLEAYRRREVEAAAAEKARPRTFYERLAQSPLAAGAAGAVEGAITGAGRLVGNVAQAATIPARAVAGAATRLYPGSPEFDLPSYALYGYDPATGAGGVQYGDLLAGTMEDAGEIKPGGAASKALRLLGNVVTDPVMAPAMMSGAEAVGALAGRATPAAAAPRLPPRAKLYPQYGPEGPVRQPPVPETPVDVTATQPVPIYRGGPPAPPNPEPSLKGHIWRTPKPEIGEVGTPKMKLWRGEGQARRPGGHRFRPGTRKPKLED